MEAVVALWDFILQGGLAAAFFVGLIYMGYQNAKKDRKNDEYVAHVIRISEAFAGLAASTKGTLDRIFDKLDAR